MNHPTQQVIDDSRENHDNDEYHSVTWKSKNVQSARKKFLENFFNVKSDWYKEWSDYIFQTSHKK